VAEEEAQTGARANVLAAAWAAAEVRIVMGCDEILYCHRHIIFVSLSMTLSRSVPPTLSLSSCLILSLSLSLTHTHSFSLSFCRFYFSVILSLRLSLAIFLLYNIIKLDLNNIMYNATLNSRSLLV
jgi:hypothetical protein